MRTDSNYILRQIVGEYVLVATGEAAQNMNGMIHLSETGGFIWKLYKKAQNLEEIVKAMLEEYEIDEETARQDVFGFSRLMYDQKLLFDVPEFED